MSKKSKTIICAFGGNALIKDGQKGTAAEQLENLRIPCRQLAKLSCENRIVITHGNGPQVGNLLLQQQACKEVPEMPLEVLVAQTQGQIGYMIEQTLDNELNAISIEDARISTVLTYVEVDKNDPGFKNPTKPIGPAYKDPQPGFVQTPKGYRKVVASPDPMRVVQYKEIKNLIDSGFIVVACGGGGIPVICSNKTFKGIDAVIDKDLASAKLGEQINADLLIIATEVEKVCLNYKKPDQKILDTITLSQAEKYMADGHFPPGNMGPKIQAAINFVKSGKERAIITSIDTLQEAIDGKTGTHIIAD